MKQNVFYEYLLAAASIVPKANIYTLQDILRPGGSKVFSPYLSKLDPRTQDWLTKRFNADIFKETKQEILYRLEAFTSPKNKMRDVFASETDNFDIGKEIQASKVIVLNTDRNKLGKAGTRALGRFFIFKVLQAMEDRMSIDRSVRVPTYFYIDEATDYIEDDDSIPDLLEKARKQSIGLVIAHHRTGPGSKNIRIRAGRPIRHLYPSSAIPNRNSDRNPQGSSHQTDRKRCCRSRHSLRPQPDVQSSMGRHHGADARGLLLRTYQLAQEGFCG